MMGTALAMGPIDDERPHIIYTYMRHVTGTHSVFAAKCLCGWQSEDQAEIQEHIELAARS